MASDCYARLGRTLVSSLLAAAVMALGAAGWSPLSHAAASSAPPGPEAFSGLSAEQAIALANRWRDEGRQVQTFVTDRALEAVWPDGRRASVPLPQNRMYVAVAPYIRTTHPCATHVISSCQGELPGRTFVVTARTREGQVVYRGTLTSLSNGFVELWLPRGLELVLEVASGKFKGTGAISTRPNAPTCITTIRLMPRA